MREQLQTTIRDMHQLAAFIDQMLSDRDGPIEPLRLQLAKAHALALADELSLFDALPATPGAARGSLR